MNRRLLIAGGAVALIVLAAALVRFVVLRDTSTPVSVEEAVRRAGALGPGGRVNGVRVPDPGVYRYETRGSEAIRALLSTTHRYPDTTAITVRVGGCGVQLRWAPFEERQSEWELCPARSGWALRSIYETHEFFGQHDERRYVCPGGVAFRRSGSWRFGCRFEGTHDEYRGRFVGRETLRVAGRPVETVHVRDTDVLSGHEEGTGSSQSWYRASDGLLVRRVVQSSDRSPAPGGTATYTERYELMLSSARPVRP